MCEYLESVFFTELIEHNAGVSSVLSPKENAFALACKNNLHVWDLDSMEISHRFECEATIDFIKWSPDAEFICCGVLRENVQVWNLKKPYWKCKINKDCLGFENIYWAPDSWHILIISNFNIKLLVFSMSLTVTEMKSPKPIENPAVFSPCEKYLVVAQRFESKDHLGIYNCDTWEAIKFFQVDTNDLAAICFSPKELVISILETGFETKVLFYSVDGRLLAKHVTEDSFGFTRLSWSIKGSFIAIGNYFGEVQIFSSFNYELLASYHYPEIIDSDEIAIYKTKETLSNKKNASPDTYSSSWETDEIIHIRPISLMALLPGTEKSKKKNLPCGVKSLLFSNNEVYLATIYDNLLTTVFIYNMEKLNLCDVVIFSSSIRSLSWHSKKPFLSLCLNSSMLAVWTPSGCMRYMSPNSDFAINNAAWCSRKECLILNAKLHSSLLFLP